MRWLDPFAADQYYHVFNHAVGKELLFPARENYFFFLQRYAHYILPVARTFAYCLMPNHFHLFIRFRPMAVIAEYAQSLSFRKELTQGCNEHTFLMQQFSNFLNSYTKSINKRYARMGSLFMDYTRRVTVDHVQYGKNLVHYIHHNPVKHGFCKRPGDWEFSSYRSLASQAGFSRLDRDELLEWFGGRGNFIAYHGAERIPLSPVIAIEL